MIKISRLADYGVVVMSVLANQAGGIATGVPGAAMAATDVSNQTHLPVPTVAKVLKLLAKSGLIKSVRGAQGGYLLAQSPENISLAQIVSAVDGPVMLTECSAGQATCSISNHCHLQGRWSAVNQVVSKALADVSLADLRQDRTSQPVLQPASQQDVA